jgi:hypothetical protein
MKRLSVLLGTGVLSLALVGVAFAQPSSRPDDDLIPVRQKKAKKQKHYELDSSHVKGLKAGKHHIGTTSTGRHLHASVNKTGKVRSVHLEHARGKNKFSKHSKVYKTARHHAKTTPLPKKKVTLLDSDAEIVPVRGGATLVVFVVNIGINRWFFVFPITVVDPTITFDPAPADPGGDDGTTEVRAADPPCPIQLTLFGPRPIALSSPSSRRSRLT